MYIYNIYYYYDFNDACTTYTQPVTQIYHIALLMTFINILLNEENDDMTTKMHMLCES